MLLRQVLIIVSDGPDFEDFYISANPCSWLTQVHLEKWPLKWSVCVTLYFVSPAGVQKH